MTSHFIYWFEKGFYWSPGSLRDQQLFYAGKIVEVLSYTCCGKKDHPAVRGDECKAMEQLIIQGFPVVDGGKSN